MISPSLPGLLPFRHHDGFSFRALVPDYKNRKHLYFASSVRSDEILATFSFLVMERRCSCANSRSIKDSRDKRFAHLLQIWEISLIAKEKDNRPPIAAFYGIVIFIRLPQKEQSPPHIHAIYGKYEVTSVVGGGSLLKGEFPSKWTALVQGFISLY